jgi:hypothetical protein
MPSHNTQLERNRKIGKGRRQQDMLVDALVPSHNTHCRKQTSRQGPENAFVAAVMPPSWSNTDGNSE